MADELRHYLARNAASVPEAAACTDGDVRLGYRDLLERVEAFSALLTDRGVVQGQRVCFLLENSARFIVVYLAILHTGAVIVPLNPATPIPALRDQIADADPALLIFEAPRAPEMEAAFAREADIEYLAPFAGGEEVGLLALRVSAPRSNTGPPVMEDEPGATGAILYTSGTTGKPKGVMLSRSNLLAIADAGQELVGLRAHEAVGVVTPLFHLYGMREIDTCIRAAAHLVIIRNLSFPTRVLAQLHEERITGLSAVPGGMAIFTERYLDQLNLCRETLRYATLGAAALSPGLLRTLRTALPLTRIYVTYGMTECSRICYHDVSGESDYSGTVGHPYQSVQIAVVDEHGMPAPPGTRGRVVLKSPMVMQGYWNQPAHTASMFAPDGFLRTPDYGRLDHQGLLFLAGRSDDMINSGGEKIFPGEVEAVLLRHAAVADAAVVGHADPLGLVDQVVKAYVVVRDNEHLDAAAIRSYCARYLETAKVPRIVEFCAALPKTVLGKTAPGLLAAADRNR